MGKHIDPRISRTKKDLRTAFSILLSQKEYSNISVKDIVDQAGYSRSTFYAHYNDRDSFLISTIKEEALLCASSVVEAHKYINSSKQFDKRSENEYLPATMFFQYVYENQDIFSLIFKSKPIPQMRQIFLDEYIRVLNDNLQYVFREDNSNIEFRLYVGAQVYMAAAEWWASQNYMYSAAYISELCFKYYCHPANKVDIIHPHKSI